MPKSKKPEQYLVSLARPDHRIKGLSVPGRGRRNFSKSGHSFTLEDGGEAKEIQREFGRDVVVSKIPTYKSPEDRGHTYNFTVQKPDEETPAERRERMIADGWVEIAPGRWKKVAQIAD